MCAYIFATSQKKIILLQRNRYAQTHKKNNAIACKLAMNQTQRNR